jgi:hypothetical protein
MKNAIKLFGIIALVAVIGFSMIACDNGTGGGGGGGGSKTASGKVTSSGLGEVSFLLNHLAPTGSNVEITFNSQTFTIVQSDIYDDRYKEFDDLTPSTEYNWTAKASTGTLSAQVNGGTVTFHISQ